ncbi:hypothetical protein COCNU_01G009830 [Cocos nucifera]|uniref:Uncharacterized protein n=1 Tax=Cocos nucifera TaxID=13894 RepID=A0A8K0HVT5_COCNU|nr:hypothetical protein COCNU_01G009830 [Cocos nucifera]
MKEETHAVDRTIDCKHQGWVLAKLCRAQDSACINLGIPQIHGCSALDPLK